MWGCDEPHASEQQSDTDKHAPSQLLDTLTGRGLRQLGLSLRDARHQDQPTNAEELAANEQVWLHLASSLDALVFLGTSHGTDTGGYPAVEIYGALTNALASASFVCLQERRLLQRLLGASRAPRRLVFPSTPCSRRASTLLWQELQMGVDKMSIVLEGLTLEGVSGLAALGIVCPQLMSVGAIECSWRNPSLHFESLQMVSSSADAPVSPLRHLTSLRLYINSPSGEIHLIPNASILAYPAGSRSIRPRTPPLDSFLPVLASQAAPIRWMTSGVAPRRIAIPTPRVRCRTQCTIPSTGCPRCDASLSSGTMSSTCHSTS